MEQRKMSSFWKNYGKSVILLASLVIGAILGYVFKEKIMFLKVFGDIFLNLLFVAVVPMIFLSIVSAIAGIEKSTNMGKLMGVMFGVFIFTLLIASTTTVGVLQFVDIPKLDIPNGELNHSSDATLIDQIVSMVTVPDFYQLLSRGNMLPLMVFSAILGYAIRLSGDTAKGVVSLIDSASDIMSNFLKIVMYIAPLGLGSYIAVMVATYGGESLKTYGFAVVLYHIVGLIFIVIFYSLCAYIWGGRRAISDFWKESIPVISTAAGTCSSIASIPSNLEAAERLRIPESIRKIAIPLAGFLHKDGTAISSVIKIVSIYAILGRPFTGVDFIILVAVVAVVISMVEGGVPNGGYTGEILLISIFQFSPDLLVVAIIIGALIDVFATVINVLGDLPASMLMARILEGKRKIED